MKERLNQAFSNMTMSEQCAARIERAMGRKLRQHTRGGYVGTVTSGGRSHWGLAACLALILMLGGGAWMLLGAPGGEIPDFSLHGSQGKTSVYTGSGYRLEYPQGWTVTEQGQVVTFLNPQLGRQALLVIEHSERRSLEQRQDQEGFVLPSSEGFENLQLQSKEVVTLDGFTGGKVRFTHGPKNSQVVQYTLVEAGYIFTCNIPETDSEEYRRTLQGMVEGIQLDAVPAPNPIPEGMSEYWDPSIRMLWPMEGWRLHENQGEDGRTLSFLEDKGNGGVTISQGEAWMVNEIIGPDGLRIFGPDEPANVEKSVRILDGSNAAYSSFVLDGIRREEYCVAVQGVGFIVNCTYLEQQKDTLGQLMEEMVESIDFFPEEDAAWSVYQKQGISLRCRRDWTVEETEALVSEMIFTARLALRIGSMDAVLERQGSSLDSRGYLQISPDEGALLINPMKEMLAGRVFASVSYIHGEPELLEMRYIGAVGDRTVGLSATCENEEQAVYLPMLVDIIDSLSFTDQSCWVTQDMENSLESEYLRLPDWSASEPLDPDFWSQLLYMGFTSAGYYPSEDGTEVAKTAMGDAEIVTWDWGDYKERFVKISQEQAQEYAMLVTGKQLPELNLQSFDDGSNRISPFYKDGYYYIAQSDFGAEWFQVKAVEYRADGNAELVFDVMVEGENASIGEVRATVALAENLRGFTVVEKESNWQPLGVEVTVYVADNWVMNMVPRKVWANGVTEQELFRAIIQALKMEGILEETELRSMSVQGDAMTLDFDQAFADQVNATGMTGENLIIGSVVNSFLDAYPQCRTVTITVEGRSWESGHVVYDGPLTRRNPGI